MFEGPLQDLIDEFSRLPGVGPKSAQRIAFHLLKTEPEDMTGSTKYGSVGFWQFAMDSL